MGLPESQGEDHERFIHICLKPFISTKDSGEQSALATSMRVWGSAGWQRERGCSEVRLQGGHSWEQIP